MTRDLNFLGMEIGEARLIELHIDIVYIPVYIRVLRVQYLGWSKEGREGEGNEWVRGGRWGGEDV